MKIQLNLDSIAVLLFCGDLVVDNTAPLSQDEWWDVERKLRNASKKTPSKLFGMNRDTMVQILGIDEYIAYKLMARKETLNDLMFALANLENEGIYITTKYEDNYPKNLTTTLKKRAPLYLYYVGDLTMTENHMVSVVGPQSLEKKLNSFTRNTVTKIFDEEKVLVANGTKGTDAYALKVFMQLGGKVVCFVSDHMFDKKKTYAKAIKEGRLVLISAVDPFAYFNVTNALDRNIYVCGLSDLQIVTATHINSGGVWFTTIQNFHYHWTKQMVLDDDNYNGNIRLLEMGAVKVTYEDMLSLLTLDQIVEKNAVVEEEEEILIDQMSIYEFLDE
ncbi:DNA-processing protein DprA [Candidatus Stoquefichus sp. SB1]|jgi:predicted Rossmann fold nucleotide-binding protein DprA/Smf involved in DNA uptake|uniref:DNA-processing protein DprA n=1 Tax=Candidatus Stoquefichus sp. SB1 TaxID=1658109 RepID=UPI00067F0A57|nr:DNA-processing protein DprA [Candidatus Stoquefichus sp. SB1]